jgi:hypothetical protein
MKRQLQMAVKLIPDSIRDVLDYNPDTGDLTWAISRGTVKAGAVTGCLEPHGYLRVRYQRTNYLAHRLCWFLHHGQQPSIIDHINRNRSDNRIANLRCVTVSESQLNRGYSGVHWKGARASKGYAGGWCATYKTQHLYSGKSILLAHFHRIMAEREDHSIGLPYV